MPIEKKTSSPQGLTIPLSISRHKAIKDLLGNRHRIRIRDMVIQRGASDSEVVRQDEGRVVGGG